MQGDVYNLSPDILRGYQAMLQLTMVPLAALAVVGTIMSILLSILQINDQALPVAIKLGVVIVILIALGGWMSWILISLAQELFTTIRRI